jgi:phenylacetate-coenzyme A ligase PaaK-like adenylate-forming protein
MSSPPRWQPLRRNICRSERNTSVAYTEKGMADLEVLPDLAGCSSCEGIVRVIGEEMKECLEIRLDVEAVAPGTLNSSEYKAKRFVDRRKK